MRKDAWTGSDGSVPWSRGPPGGLVSARFPSLENEQRCERQNEGITCEHFAKRRALALLSRMFQSPFGETLIGLSNFWKKKRNRPFSSSRFSGV